MPSVAVVVASKDRCARLASLLDALRAQTFTAFTVVVVDDGSGDATSQLLAGAAGLDLQVLRNDASLGPSVARDDGWRACDAQLIVFTDDDCEPDREWLEALVAAHEAAPDAILQGATEPLSRERELLSRPGARTQVVRKAGPYYQCCNIAYPRAVLERVGGFDRALGWGGEDADLAWRAIDAGTPVAWVPEARVEHAVLTPSRAQFVRSAGSFSAAMRLIAAHRALRREALVWGIFWKRSHALALLALLGVLLARRLPPAVLLVLPYARHVRRSALGDPSWVPALIAFDVLETLATARAALRHRAPVL